MRDKNGFGGAAKQKMDDPNSLTETGVLGKVACSVSLLRLVVRKCGGILDFGMQLKEENVDPSSSV